MPCRANALLPCPAASAHGNLFLGLMTRGRAARLAQRATMAVLAGLLACLLVACAPRRAFLNEGTARHTAPEAAGGVLLRADPGYLQWLERQSMLGVTPQFTAQVSGTELIWRNSATARRVPLLLGAAPNWLDINPYSVSAGQPVFQALALPGLPEFLDQAGLSGLFIGPGGERGDIWNKHKQPTPGGGNVTSLYFDPTLGNEADFETLAQRLDQFQIQLGGELPPAATGLGPDFILQARHASRFDGLYAMIALPQKDWNVLPKVPDAWECLPLRPQAVAQLIERGLLPRALARDSLEWATPGGWAATGEVRGADGQNRRWVYRYSGDALRPVLLWQDPSGQARRIFSAAIIRHTGLQQQTLAGLRLEALMGLDVPALGDDAQPHATAGHWAHLTPGLEALDELGREIHRYGGWAMQDDVLPPSLTPAVLATSVDFTRDTVTSPAAAYALLSGDAAPLAALLRASLAAGVDHSRLARGRRDWQAMDWRPLLDLPQGRELMRKARQLAGDGTENGSGAAEDASAPGAWRIWTSPCTQATLAARALGLDTAQAVRPEHAVAMREACLLLLGWRAGLPGLAFVSPQDLTGALNLPQSPAGLPASMGSVPLWRERAGTGLSQSAPAAPLAFGPLDRQWADERSFARRVARLLQVRRETGLAQGKLLTVLPGPPGCLAVLSTLPGGGNWLLAANFSGKKQTFSITLPPTVVARSARDALEGQNLPLHGRGLNLDLDARQSRHVLLAG